MNSSAFLSVPIFYQGVKMSKFQGPSPRKMMRREVEEIPSDSDSDDGLVDSDDGLDKETRDAIFELDKFQAEIADLDNKAAKEILEIEEKYNETRKPIYAKREVAIGKVPTFWSKVIMNHPHLNMIIDDEEEDVLSFLVKVEIQEEDNVEDGFCIKMGFNDNPYFENRELVKVFQLGGSLLDGFVEPTTSSTVIKWKEGKGQDLQKKLEEIIQKRKGEMTSFFDWFTGDKNPDDDQVADAFKDDLWPNPLIYFLHQGGMEEVEEEGEEEEVEEEEEDDSDGISNLGRNESVEEEKE
ncbi:Protein SET [Orchesella cincta]|uniref:Protein SET n=1 Tax=Orchesella cincta TaxID=48709 RepID=A0A1D2MHW1_ORCCI|nr:Protein SET [Orchesella cincta]